MPWCCLKILYVCKKGGLVESSKILQAPSSSASSWTARIVRKEAQEVPYATVSSKNSFTLPSGSLRNKFFLYMASSGCTRTCLYIFSISAVSAYQCERNLVSRVNRSSCMVGPTISVSFSDTPVEVFAEPSKTTRIFVVLLSSFITG